MGWLVIMAAHGNWWHFMDWFMVLGYEGQLRLGRVYLCVCGWGYLEDANVVKQHRTKMDKWHNQLGSWKALPCSWWLTLPIDLEDRHEANGELFLPVQDRLHQHSTRPAPPSELEFAW